MIEIEEFLGYTDSEINDYLKKTKFVKNKYRSHQKIKGEDLGIISSSRWTAEATLLSSYLDDRGFCSGLGITYNLEAPIPGDLNTTNLKNIGSPTISYRKSGRKWYLEFIWPGYIYDRNKFKIRDLGVYESSDSPINTIRKIRETWILYWEIIDKYYNRATSKDYTEIEDCLGFLIKKQIPINDFLSAIKTYISISEKNRKRGKKILDPKYIPLMIVDCRSRAIPSDLIKKIKEEVPYKTDKKEDLDKIGKIIQEYDNSLLLRMTEAKKVLETMIKEVKEKVLYRFGLNSEDIVIKMDGNDI